MVLDFLHAEIAYIDDGSLRHFAEGELHHQIVTVAAAGDDGLAGLRLSSGQILTVQGSVALFLVAVVEEDLKGHVLIALDVGGYTVVHAGLGDQACPDIQTGLPYAGIPGGGEVFDADPILGAGEDRGIALVVLFKYEGFPLKVHRRGKRILVIHLVRVLFDLDLGKVDRKGREHAELQIKIARSGTCRQDAGEAVVALADLKLLEVAELDLACHVRMEAVGNAVVPAGDGGIVALELDVPGLSVGLCGGKAIHAVDSLAFARDGAAFKLGAEHIRRDTDRLHFSSGGGHRLCGLNVGRRFPEGRQQSRRFRRRFRRRSLLFLCFRRRLRKRLRRSFRIKQRSLGHAGERLTAAGEQKRDQQNKRDNDPLVFHNKTSPL